MAWDFLALAFLRNKDKLPKKVLVFYSCDHSGTTCKSNLFCGKWQSTFKKQSLNFQKITARPVGGKYDVRVSKHNFEKQMIHNYVFWTALKWQSSPKKYPKGFDPQPFLCCFESYPYQYALALLKNKNGVRFWWTNHLPESAKNLKFSRPWCGRYSWLDSGSH